ncbi:MAG: carbohydrate kinase family protein [Candidatus Falkowbacteria bacterium]|nr:carbohydrate kinase family protein [Candidatus Falkowbacteria bacterium]
MRNNKSKIVVSGSLAYDQIMDFPGRFSDHILPTEIHNLNLSFFLSNSRRSFGGTAGNIAYNLTLLQEKLIILGVAGFDFDDYYKWLKNNGVNLNRVKIVSSDRTAAAYIITDKADNQIAAFYPGARPKDYARSAGALKNIDLAIIAADDKQRMLGYVAAYQKNNVPYIFDPGQALIAFSPAELRRAIKGAKVLIGNDYEIKLIADKMKLPFSHLVKMVKILIITLGAKGSIIYSAGQKIIIKPAKPKNTSDPTGAGDAYRAGLIKGLIKGYNLKTCGQLAGLVAVYTVEKFGTQTHRFSLAELKKRYYQNYKERLII